MRALNGLQEDSTNRLFVWHKPIDELAGEFVLVRLTEIEGADLRLFEFDHDLTWFVFF